MEVKERILNYMEVQIVLNLASDTTREVVTNGDIVDFGRLSTLSPSFSVTATLIATPRFV